MRRIDGIGLEISAAARKVAEHVDVDRIYTRIFQSTPPALAWPNLFFAEPVASRAFEEDA